MKIHEKIFRKNRAFMFLAFVISIFFFLSCADEGSGDSDYPGGAYGSAVGDVIPDLSFNPGNSAAVTLAGNNGTVELKDLYLQSVSRDGTLNGVYIYVTSANCTECQWQDAEMETMYQSLAPLGIEFLAVVLADDTGEPASLESVKSMSDSNGWTFPAVSGEIPADYYPVESPSKIFPFNLLLDARTMQIYGRHSVDTAGMFLLEDTLTEIATNPLWSSDGGARIVAMDCAAGSSTENEPNNSKDTPENAATLPFTMTGTLCAPVIAEGLILDKDVMDLGTLNPGDALDVQLSFNAGISVYPFAELVGYSTADNSVIHQSHLMLSAGISTDVGRQWVIDTPGHYYLQVYDGRAMSHRILEGLLTEENRCCGGGSDQTYTVSVNAATITTNYGQVSAGDNTNLTIDLQNTRIHELLVEDGTKYEVRMIADNSNLLDPYLTVVDSTGEVIAFNDDEDKTAGVFDSMVAWTASYSGSAYLVAGYSLAAEIVAGPLPGYTIRVQ